MSVSGAYNTGNSKLGPDDRTQSVLSYLVFLLFNIGHLFSSNIQFHYRSVILLRFMTHLLNKDSIRKWTNKTNQTRSRTRPLTATRIPASPIRTHQLFPYFPFFPFENRLARYLFPCEVEKFLEDIKQMPDSPPAICWIQPAVWNIKKRCSLWLVLANIDFENRFKWNR